MLEKIDLSKKNEYVSPKILEIVHKRKIKKLIHFTNIKNLESILHMGICSRRYLWEYEIKFESNDPYRKDKKRDCSSFSIEYPNSSYLNSLKKKNPEKIFCMIILDAERLLPNILDKYYVYCNAATTEASSFLDSEVLTRPKFFENMFYNSSISYLPGDVQAEILIKGIVPTEYIQEIHFSDSRDFDAFKAMCEDIALVDKYKMVISDFYFKDRDQIFWEQR